ncbi:hypothetical protein [Sphingobium sp. IP1]|nr:hypothetical protein [Sphingobium sp. IP1]
MPDVCDLDDASLIAIWNDADPENLSDYEREVIEEMKARDIVPR